MLTFTEQEILEITGGVRVCAQYSTEESMVSSISTDTRTIEAGALFVALIGERFDGHAFCIKAYEKGAVLQLISDENMLPKDARGILVPDTLLALHALARAYRRKLRCIVIAVTGSVGKTSTREMLFAAFSSSKRTHATKHNLNNEIGLPLTILSAPADTELLIVEMGMRMRGEIRILSFIAEPDIAIITHVGLSHIERLGSREEILLAKMEICEGLTGDKLLLINGDDPYLTEYVQNAESAKNAKSDKNVKSVQNTEKLPWNKLGYTTLQPDRPVALSADLVVAAHEISHEDQGTGFFAICSLDEAAHEVDLGAFFLPCVGIHHVKNALFSIACAMYLGISMEDIKKGLLSFLPTGSRGRIIKTKNYLVYDDVYNASPESMAAAFESVRILAGQRRKVAVIGGILELGLHAREQHYNVGMAAAQSGMDILYVCGEYSTEVKEGAIFGNPEMPVYLFDSRDELIDALLPELLDGDVILVKASHSFAMEKVVQAILEQDRSFNFIQTEENQ